MKQTMIYSEVLAVARFNSCTFVLLLYVDQEFRLWLTEIKVDHSLTLIRQYIFDDRYVPTCCDCNFIAYPNTSEL